MFSEISVKEEAYKSEAGTFAYLALPLCPATTNASGVDMIAQACFGAADWKAVRVSPTESTTRCTYVVTTGTGTPSALPAWVTTPTAANFSGTTPFYWIVGTCDMDNQGGTNAQFFTASWDQSIQKTNYGS